MHLEEQLQELMRQWKLLGGAAADCATDVAKLLGVYDEDEEEEDTRELEKLDLFQRWATPEHMERLEAGFLPDKEYNQGVRSALFREVKPPPMRYRRLEDDAIEHETSCPGPQASWRTERPDELTEGQWRVFTSIRESCEGLRRAHACVTAVSCAPRRHVGRCQACGAVVDAFGILVLVTTAAGNTFTREYALPSL